MSTATAPVLPGETLGDGKYRVERILGKGGMGIVVAAKHVALDERVAIKFLLGDPGPAAVERFLREARAAVKVKGEHVCRVLDFGRLESGEPYIVMEYLEGTDLAKLVERSGAQKTSAAVGFIVEACDALAEAHALGIVHRDIKPANIFLAKRGDDTTVAKVLDFGISKLPSQTQAMTGTQTTMGSPAYMSPEQMESARDVDARSDVWSIGVTLYELLMGKPPFVADSMVQLTVLVREKEPPPLDGVPDALAHVILKCLAKERTNRYQTVSALVAALAPFAPEEVLGIVRRHAKRDSLTGGDAAFAVTALQDKANTGPSEGASEGDPEKQKLTASRSDKTNEKGVGKGTFAPVQSTLDERSRAPDARRRSATILVLAIAFMGALSLGVVVVTRSASGPVLTPSAAPETSPRSSTREEPFGVSPSNAPPSTPPPMLSASTGSTAAVASSSTIAQPLAVPRPMGTASMRTSTQTPTAAVSSVAFPPTASAPSATSPSKPEPKKRRDLDRDDP
ncbi:MAG: protein kinase [Deltaproteobacteria bacterium]|nr:protein kinase [Deltaproteobacteria bacterium]